MSTDTAPDALLSLTAPCQTPLAISVIDTLNPPLLYSATMPPLPPHSPTEENSLSADPGTTPHLSTSLQSPADHTASDPLPPSDVIALPSPPLTDLTSDPPLSSGSTTAGLPIDGEPQTTEELDLSENNVTVPLLPTPLQSDHTAFNPLLSDIVTIPPSHLLIEPPSDLPPPSQTADGDPQVPPSSTTPLDIQSNPPITSPMTTSPSEHQSDHPPTPFPNPPSPHSNLDPLLKITLEHQPLSLSQLSNMATISFLQKQLMTATRTISSMQKEIVT